MNHSPCSTVRMSVSNDVCEHASGLDEWVDNRYHQLEKKSRFHGSLSNLVGDKIRITREVIDTPLIEQFGRVPSDKVLLLNIQSECDVLLNGRFVNSGSFHISSGKPIHAIAKSPISASIITLEKDFFIDMMAGTTSGQSHKVFETFLTPSHGSVLDFEKSMNHNFNESISLAPSTSGLNRLVSSIQEIMLSENDQGVKGIPPSTRAYIVDKSCELLFENFADEDFGVLEMCHHLRVSRRTLQYSFESIMGMSPSNYVRTVRLNTARKSLILSPQDKIQGAALDAGFSHLGRFSKYYQDFFGELPSATVGRFHHGKHH